MVIVELSVVVNARVHAAAAPGGSERLTVLRAVRGIDRSSLP